MPHPYQTASSEFHTPTAKQPSGCIGMAVVTVVYRGEMDLLMLQARSLARFMPATCIQEILVILNDWDLTELELQVENLRTEYGVHAARLRIIHPSELLDHRPSLSDIPNTLIHWFKYASRAVRGRKTGWQGSSGWLMQQALKLGAGRVTNAECMLYLDAKNHLIAPVKMDDFFEQGIRPRARLEVVHDNYFEWHKNAQRFLGLLHHAENRNLPPSITPFACCKSQVCDAIKRIETSSGALKYFFKPKSSKGTEFTLIATLTAQHEFECGIGFSAGLLPFSSVFRDATVEDVDAMLELAIGNKTAMLGTHSGRISTFTSDQKDQLVAIWQASNLVPTAQDGHAILSRIVHG